MDTARDAIKLAIASGQYGPGDILPSERALAPMLGISRLSLRKALIDLREAGYLTSELGMLGGNRVTSLAAPVIATRRLVRDKPRLYAEAMEYRIAIECETARLAAQRASRANIRKMQRAVLDLQASQCAASFRKFDGAFHTSVAESAQNERLVKAVADIRSELFLLSGELSYTILETTLSAHSAILAAISQHDAAAAEVAMRAHLEQAAVELLTP